MIHPFPFSTLFVITNLSMKSLEYTHDGTIQEIKETYNGLPFFRKHTDAIKYKNELAIANLLYNHPCSHCVKIYNINKRGSHSYIDMELLDTEKLKVSEQEKVNHDIYIALEELHIHQVIYIDLKSDNIGYSEIDKTWKLFDFDGSGITDSTFSKWIEQPPYLYAYKEAVKIYHMLDGHILSIEPSKYSFPNLLLIDQVIYKSYVNEVDNI